jgi:hypothetical protein
MVVLSAGEIARAILMTSVNSGKASVKEAANSSYLVWKIAFKEALI